MKAALIGLGMVADTHVAALNDSRTVDLHGVWSRSRSKTRDFAKKASQRTGASVRAYSTLQDLAFDPELDFAIIATPPDARYEIVAYLVSAKKPILMEKPVERRFDASKKIVALCAEHQVPLGIVFQHRVRAASVALKDAVQSGRLGEILAAEVRIPWWRDQAYYEAPGRGSYARDGGGVMITQAIHTLDLLLWVLGPIRHVQALLHTTRAHRMEAEDWAGALFQTLGGVVGSLTATTAAFPGEAESIRIYGTQGSARLESGRLELTDSNLHTEMYGEASASGSGSDPMAFTHAWHQAVIEDFAHALRNKRSPIASGISALQAHAVIDALERANKTGQRTEVEIL